MTTTSTAPDRTSMSQISNACSPVSGWLMSNWSMSTPIDAAYTGSMACSASMYAQMPPLRCASATTCMASVDLPDDSGPKISTTRPRGKPPTPSAKSSDSAPVWMASMAIVPFSPMRMMDPLPNCLSLAANATSSAFSRSLLTVVSVSCLVLSDCSVEADWHDL